MFTFICCVPSTRVNHQSALLVKYDIMASKSSPVQSSEHRGTCYTVSHTNFVLERVRGSGVTLAPMLQLQVGVNHEQIQVAVAEYEGRMQSLQEELEFTKSSYNSACQEIMDLKDEVASLESVQEQQQLLVLEVRSWSGVGVAATGVGYGVWSGSGYDCHWGVVWGVVCEWCEWAWSVVWEWAWSVVLACGGCGLRVQDLQLVVTLYVR